MLRSPEETILNGLIGAVADRQEILANNLTNVTTPGFVRQDMDFNSVMKDLKNKDMTGKSIDRIMEDATFADDNQSPSLEKELAEMSMNHTKYILLTRINGHIYQHMEEATQAGRGG